MPSVNIGDRIQFQWFNRPERKFYGGLIKGTVIDKIPTKKDQEEKTICVEYFIGGFKTSSWVYQKEIKQKLPNRPEAPKETSGGIK